MAGSDWQEFAERGTVYGSNLTAISIAERKPVLARLTACFGNIETDYPLGVRIHRVR